jgi:hypothetical protein
MVVIKSINKFIAPKKIFGDVWVSHFVSNEEF